MKTVETTPEIKFDDYYPLMNVPEYHNKNGHWYFKETLDIDRVDEDSFSYISGGLFVRKRSLGFNIKLAVEPNCISRDNLTMRATVPMTKHGAKLQKQLRQVYETKEYDTIEEYVDHKESTTEFMEDLKKVFKTEDVGCATVIPHVQKYTGTTVRDVIVPKCFVSLINIDGTIKACSITIGGFCESYILEELPVNEVDPSSMPKDGKEKPVLTFTSSDNEEIGGRTEFCIEDYE